VRQLVRFPFSLAGRLFIRHQEEALAELHGEAWYAYRADVGRWI
jgi:hypothetical protein